ncbi:hypothetical protein [Candidatus Hodarchaeum mangrovi]
MPTLFDSFQKGQKESKDWKLQFETSRSLSNFFADEFLDNYPSLFVTTTEALRLSQLLGQITEASKNINETPQINVIGPHRSGKTATVKEIMRELNKNQHSNYVKYLSYTDNFWSHWEEENFTSTQIVFLDHIYPIWNHFTPYSLTDLKDRSSNEHIIVVALLSSLEHHWLRIAQNSPIIKLFEKEPYEYLYKRPLIQETGQIIQKRLQNAGKPELLSQDVLKTISIISLGLPGLALWITRNLLSQPEEKTKTQEINPTYIHDLAAYLGFKPALKIVLESNSEISGVNEALSNYNFWPLLEPLKKIQKQGSSSLLSELENFKLATKTSKSILEEILILARDNGEIKRSELLERTGIKESSLTYQCQKLVKERIVSYSKAGRDVYYHIESPVKEALELILLN